MLMSTLKNFMSIESKHNEIEPALWSFGLLAFSLTHYFIDKRCVYMKGWKVRGKFSPQTTENAIATIEETPNKPIP